MITSEQFLGKWVTAIFLDHFKKQKNYAEKLFIKLSGLTEQDIRFVLNELIIRMDSLKQYYDPIVRTITPITGFEGFQFQAHETSTWLRNNTKASQALILVINEMTPEAQSLENLFSIDESYLLSEKGLNILFDVLVHEFHFATDEINELRSFLHMLNSVAEPQLRNLLQFIVQIVNDGMPSIIHRIQRQLPELNLFRDSKLKISQSHASRLKNNYMLANLQKGSSLLDGEKLLEKLDSFLEQEEKNNWVSELWDATQPEFFRKEVVDFIQLRSKSLLKYEYELIEGIFNFKVKQTLAEKVKETINLEGKTKEERHTIEAGIEAIAREEDPDEIQGFLEEYEGELSSSPGLVKSISRLIERLRHPSEYNDIHEALLYEAFVMIDENFENIDLTNSYFRLKVLPSKMKEKVQKLLILYFRGMKNMIPLIEFDETSIPQEYDDSVKEDDISFELLLMKEQNVLDKRKFKILDFGNNEVYSLFELVKDNKLPYIKNYAEQEVDKIDVRKYVERKIKYYLTTQTEEMNEHFEKFNNFADQYIHLLNEACKNGLLSIDLNQLEELVESWSSNIYSSVNVTKSVYRAIHYIGSIDTLDVKKGEIGAAHERILTVFNPIRLLSYLHRMKEINKQLHNWINKAIEKDLIVHKLDDYLVYVIEKLSNLAPRYFVSEDETSYLLETTERLGNGTFVVNTRPASSSEYLSKELSKELVQVTKNYLEVYPYAKDGLDLLFLYCQSAEVVIKSIDELFKNIPKLSKLKLTVHSTQAAQLHKDLNKWIELREEYRNAVLNTRFPKLEVNVIGGTNINDISTQIRTQMFDADLVVLMDYFGQNEQIKYTFNSVRPINSDTWFIEPYKEPVVNQESVKRIPYVSEQLPKVLQQFYQLQYIVQSNSMPNHDELHLLNVTISASNFNDGYLIDFMHDYFNWVVIMDRFLDKSLLQKASSKAQIIQYKSKAGRNKNFKLILSSTQYVRKLNSETQDYNYYDRLHRKLASILKNEQIQREIIIRAVDRVKDISGALVLKVIGPGKYAHEMLATYLAIERRKNENAVLQVWSICDELPWFASNKRRPDLVSTVIYKQGEKIIIDFELVELKFVNHNILDRERLDAIKQIEAGLNEYKKLFSFEKNHADAEYWKSELGHYLIEKQAYSPKEVDLLKELQIVSVSNIQVNISASIDVYCYTSNITDRHFECIEEGVYLEKLENDFQNYIYNRHYILKQLGADEEQIPSYEEFKVDEEPATTMIEKQISINKDANNNFINEETNMKINNKVNYDNLEVKTSESIEEKDHSTAERKNFLVQTDTKQENTYAEIEALKGMTLNNSIEIQDHEELKTELERLLVRNFAKNDINIKVKESIVGSSVIRFYLDLPSNVTTKKVTSRSQDIQVWLRLNNEPTFSIDSKGMYMDIIRENPDTIYFENFMQLVRNQLQSKINETNLITPLGLDPLNQVVSIDLSDSTTPHLLVGGTTGSGKSVTLNSIILSIMCLYKPEDVKFVFIDPKQVEFNFYKGKTHTMDVITQIEGAVIKLEELVTEMDERYSLMNQEYVSNLEEYVKVTGNKLPRIVVVFDEFADFMSQDKEIAKRVENAIQRLGQKARAAGIHLIICTQYPKAEIINTKIRANLPGRLALKAADSVASQVILDQDGAEKLAGKGDFLAKTTGSPIRGKSPFLTPEVKRALLKYFEKENA
jgi:DNA segregation ATPase FtsK/SpoIIIE, S-DNA-T family